MRQWHREGGGWEWRVHHTLSHVFEDNVGDGLPHEADDPSRLE